jgi:peptide/nickel transport system permease protein
VLLARRLGTLVATALVAVAVAHVFLATTVEGAGFLSAVKGTPALLSDRFVHGEFGSTGGGSCDQRETYTPLCSRYPASELSTMLRRRVPIDVVLLCGGLLFGTLLGVVGGRWCATRPRSRGTAVLHAATALQLASPPFLQALVVLFYFSNASDFLRLPLVSGSGDYVALSGHALGYVKALWTPCLLAGLPLAAFVLRITEATLREDLQEDFVRTARAKGLSERRVVDLHALPVALPGIVAMTGVNVSTLLLNVAVMEYAFSIPGMFSVVTTASLHADVPVLEALVVEGVFLVTLANLAVDAIQARIDPRVRSL